MHKTIITLFSLLAVFSAVSIPNTGELLITGPGLYSVSAALDFNKTTEAGVSLVNMLVSLYTSQTFLTSDCGGFGGYFASNHIANVSNVTDNLILANNNITGSLSSVNLWVDSNHWQQNDSAIYADRCPVFDSSHTTYNGSNLSGVIGFGYTNTTLANYGANIPTLSVYLNEDLRGGKLFFGLNEARTARLFSAVKFNTLSDWRVPGVSSVTIGGASYSVRNSSEYQMIFDLNTDVIGIPETIYNIVIQGFEDSSTLSCVRGSLSNPVCGFTGNLTDLPTIDIAVGDKILRIPPQAYVINASTYNATTSGVIILALKALTPNSANPRNHVLEPFRNTIILGARVFSYYQVVFTGSRDLTNSAGTVELFEVNPNFNPDPSPTPGPEPTPAPTPDPSSSAWWIILVVVAVVLVGVGLCCYITKRKSDRSEREISNNLLRA